MTKPTTAVVLGAGGFIGGHLCRRLRDEGFAVQGVDIKPLDQWHQQVEGVEKVRRDLRIDSHAHDAVAGATHVYNLAADMGGIGFIERNRFACAMSVLVTANVIQACLGAGVDRYFYSSSACVYPAGAQDRANLPPLAERMAIPAEPEAGYGWEKLYGELLAQYAWEDHGLETRVARFHNIYGPHTEYEGGREKAPAALCRKVALAGEGGGIEVWGSGQQTRSFCWVDDCVEGVRLLMDSDVREPLNIGSSEGVTIDRLIDLIEDAAGFRVNRRYDTAAPMGVQGRNSDNTLVWERLGWVPSTPLADGIAILYEWVAAQPR